MSKFNCTYAKTHGKLCEKNLSNGLERERDSLNYSQTAWHYFIQNHTFDWGNKF